MSFNWREYLHLAEHMQANVQDYPDEEACYRSIISRTYYATFCMIRNYVRDVDNYTSHGDVHQALQQYLLNHSHRGRQRLGNQLKTLRQHRNKADYNDVLDELPSKKASQVLSQARRLMSTFDQLPPS